MDGEVTGQRTERIMESEAEQIGGCRLPGPTRGVLPLIQMPRLRSGYQDQ